MVGERLRCHYLRVFDLTSIKLLSQCHSGTEFTICMKRDKETICQILKTASRMRWTNHQSHSKQADDSRHTSEDLNNNFDTTSYVIPTWIKIALEYGQRVGTLQQNHESMLFSGSGENSNDGRHILEQKPTSLSFGESHVNFKLTEEEEDFIILANRFNCGRPDWVVATVALLTGKSTGFQILGFWERHAVSSYFWHRRNASSRHIVMLLQSIHVACEEHAPQVSVALRLAGYVEKILYLNEKKMKNFLKIHNSLNNFAILVYIFMEMFVDVIATKVSCSKHFDNELQYHSCAEYQFEMP